MNKKKENSHFFAWWVFIASCLISLVGFGLIVNTIGLFFEPISKSFHVGRASVALMTTLQNAAAAITLLFAGKIMTKLNLRWLLTFCFAVIGVSMLSLSAAQSLTHFYIAWIIIGICQPIAITLSIPVLLGNWFNEKLGTVMGISLGVSAFGGTIFNPIIGNIITNFGWRGGFICEGLLILGILVPSAFFLREKPNQKHQAYGKVKNIPEKVLETSGVTLKAALKTPVFYALAFAMLALQFVSGSVQHISGHITSQGLPLTIGASVVSGVMLGAAAGKISIGFMLDRFNTRATLFIYSLFGLLGWSGEIFFKTSLPLIASAFILGLGQGVCLVALPYLIREEFGAKDYSTILSVINMTGAFAMSASVYLNGLLFDTTGSYNFGWAINATAFALSFVALFLTLKKQNASQPLEESID
ncbi:MFS transporter [Lactobacillus johnsonii]|uniref:MFS transporter n=1 Tax=Lactobacillus johnsonii TaxID=33959 RepID=UPI000BEEA8F6|nr:MFS transporter [Lactobacillus johnsonii]PEG67219.1 MFS transporter [Lactobacillus johnsonii]